MGMFGTEKGAESDRMGGIVAASARLQDLTRGGQDLPVLCTQGRKCEMSLTVVTLIS